MNRPSAQKILVFQKKILSWYAKNKRDLPWRKTRNPYHILVSEIMLQQTQVYRVIEYYLRWLEKLPNLQKLARVDTKTLLSLWSGLGYNNRALRLRDCARALREKYKGTIPKTYDELVTLPGIGEYTANAVLAFAFNKTVPVFDTNIRRVLLHEFNLSKTTSLLKLKEFARACIPQHKSCVWHNALMDYGALVLTAKKTKIKPLSQQGTFKGSDREVRGHIIRELTKKKKLSLEEIKRIFTQKDIHSIVEKMKRDKLIKVEENKVFLT